MDEEKDIHNDETTLSTTIVVTIGAPHKSCLEVARAKVHATLYLSDQINR
jgi:hypothetical protein